MSSRILLTSLAIFAASVGASAQTAPLWLRTPAISPDGSTIAFTYKGHIYTVPAQGGAARMLTSGDGFDSAPVWSPNGKLIAFASDREGSDDVYVVEAKGGTPTRLTFNSAIETPRAFLDDNTIVFDARVMPSQTVAAGPFQNQTYTVDVKGGRPKMLMSLPTLAMDVNSKGDILYRDRKGYEDPLRKHERSSGTSDIWLKRGNEFTKLTTFNGHDIDPVWGDGENFFYLSEENDNNLNVYARNIDGSGKKQLTSFKNHPVRSLSGSDNGLLAFSWDGEIYTLRPGAEPRKVTVEILADNYDSDLVKGYRTSGATNIAVSPSGEEVAFVLRGDIYVTSVKYKTTKRVTDTPGQERNISFSPDGRSLVYDSERDGKWQIFITKIKDDKEKNFTYATDLTEELLYSCPTAAQQPAFSPDGEKVAFLENRTEVKVIDVKSKKAHTALDGKFNYSYADGDVPFEWSPDSRWILTPYIGVGGWNNLDVALVAADGSKVVDLTESGYSDYSPQWVMNGKGIAYMSGRYGYKNHASWGNEDDVILMMLDPEGWDEFNMTQEERDLAKAKENDDKDKDTEKKKDDKGKKKDDKKKADADKVKPLDFDLEGRKYRTKRLTGNSGFLGSYFLSPDGAKLYYIVSDPAGKNSLMERDLLKGETKVLVPNIKGGFEADKKGENLYVISFEGLSKVKLADGSVEPIEFEALYTRTPSGEREYIYEHMLNQVRDKFYDSNLHGVDWDFYGDAYRRFLPFINNNRDFATLLSEILGELNASHTGGSYRGSGATLQTASLGAYFDENYVGDGLKVNEVVKQGPLSTKKADIQPGDIILAIDGSPILKDQNYDTLLEGKAGKKVRLTVSRDGKSRDVEVRPITADRLKDLLYERWIDRNRQIVDSVSGGRIGYVHVKSMDDESYRRVYQDLLGKYRNSDAVVVDTRFNNGGWLHNDLMILLSGKEYVRYMPRGRYIGSEPWAQWNKPSVMLVNEGNYSDAHGTPVAYQTLGIGDVVGAPVPGTMTAVWWETQIDPTLVFGIPQVTNEVDGVAMENHQLNPDILIYNEPARQLAGEDQQLVGAVKALMEKTKK